MFYHPLASGQRWIGGGKGEMPFRLFFQMVYSQRTLVASPEAQQYVRLVLQQITIFGLKASLLTAIAKFFQTWVSIYYYRPKLAACKRE